MLKFVGAATLAVLAFGSASAQVYVQPQVRSDGVYVPGHYRTAPNSTRADNWSSRPNVNPYNGKIGTRDPYSYSPPRSSYKPYSPRPVTRGF